MLRNTPNFFGSIAKTFHWVIALIIICLLIMGFIMANIEPSPTKMMLYALHKSTGVLALILVTLRLTWRFLNPVPELPSSLRPWHHRIAKLSPIALYALLFTMPLSGITLSEAGGYPITVYNLFNLPMLLSKNPDLSKNAVMIHKYGGFAFIGILILHVCGALYHHIILKTNILKRMLPSWFRRS